MYYKKLVGNKVYLSPIDKNDYQKYTEWVNDMEVGIGMIFANKLIDEEGYFALLSNRNNEFTEQLRFTNESVINWYIKGGLC